MTRPGRRWPARGRRARPLVAARALRQLVADPGDTVRVFEVINAMAGPALTRGLGRFRRTELGRRVLRERTDLLDLLQDRDKLGALPAGTLGRAYHDFVYGESLTAGGLVAASMNETVQTYGFDDAELRRFGERVRDQHDLLHALTRYGRDPFGEVCLLAFSYAQLPNRGIGMIVLVGAWKLGRELGFGVPRALWQAYRAGQRAIWLPAQDWEALLRMPLADVRRHLGIRDPSAYLDVRPPDLPAMA